MLSSHCLVDDIPQKYLSLEEYREVDKLINSNEFCNLNLFPYAAKKLINLYNRNPLIYLDPRECCNEIDLSPEEAYSSNQKTKNRHIKTESHDDHSHVDARNCISCGRSCRYPMYTLIPSISGKIISSSNPNATLFDYVWCPKCYTSGRLPPTLPKNHFTRFQVPFEFADEESSPWTDDELYLLIGIVENQLDSINTYRDDWTAVGKAVSRSPHECLLKFSQLPIEDIIFKGGSLDISLEPVVFDKTPNEFLAYLAFISNSISPVISSGGAKAALDILLSESNYLENITVSKLDDVGNELMFKDETFKSAYDEAKRSTKQKTQLLADLERVEIEKLLKEIYDLELQIADVQAEKFELLEHKLREYTSVMGDSLITKPQYPQ